MKWINSQTPEAIAAHRDALANLAIELTLQTGDVVTSELSDYHYDFLYFPEGVIDVETTDRGRYIFSPARPKNAQSGIGYPDHCPKITTSAERPPAAMAAGVIRRLLDEARAYWQEWQRLIDKHAQEVADFTINMERLEAAGMTRPYHLTPGTTRATICTATARAPMFPTLVSGLSQSTPSP